MPRYIVERNFRRGRSVPLAGAGSLPLPQMTETNGQHGVTWITSFISSDHSRSFCLCDAPNPEAIRRCARTNRLPVERITRITVLDPYAYSEADFSPISSTPRVLVRDDGA